MTRKMKCGVFEGGVCPFFMKEYDEDIRDSETSATWLNYPVEGTMKIYPCEFCPIKNDIVQNNLIEVKDKDHISVMLNIDGKDVEYQWVKHTITIGDEDYIDYVFTNIKECNNIRTVHEWCDKNHVRVEVVDRVVTEPINHPPIDYLKKWLKEERVRSLKHFDNNIKMFEACEKYIENANDYRYWPLCPKCNKPFHWNNVSGTWECLNDGCINYISNPSDIKRAKKITIDEWMMVMLDSDLNRAISDHSETVDWPGSVDGEN